MGKNKSESSLEVGLHDAGHVFDMVFSGIRLELTNLYDQCPSFTREKLLQIYFGAANRNIHIISATKVVKEEEQDVRFLHSFTISNTSLGNSFTLQEAADASVDAIQKAVKNLISMRHEIMVSGDPLDSMSFVKRELELSNLYDIYESYWMALVWGDYQFYSARSKEESYIVSQQRSEFEESKCLSLSRKLKLQNHEVMITKDAGFHHQIYDGLYIDVEGGGKNRALIVKKITNASDSIKLQCLSFKIQINEIGRRFSKALTEAVQNRIGVSVVDLLNVFNSLSLLAHSFSSRFPKNSRISNPKQFCEYSPKLKISELISAISSTTNLPRKECEKALDYLSFTSAGKRDLWCYPLIKTNCQQVLLLTSALSAPSVNRLVENWLNDLGVDMSPKGTAYEKLVFKLVRDAISGNKLFRDCRIELSKIFTAPNGGGSEEIDIIIKIGNLIVIGELKSIVTTDSPISAYRAKKTLSGAAEQVKRKTDFFKNDVKLYLGQLKWDCMNSCDLRFCPIIVDGGKSLVGASIEDVPVCDEIILKKFFETGRIPLLSKDSDTHLAWFNVYRNFQEAENVFPIYIANPPQMSRAIHETKYLESYLKPHSSLLSGFVFKRLAPGDINVASILTAKTLFPIFTSTGFESEIKKMDLLA